MVDTNTLTNAQSLLLKAKALLEEKAAVKARMVLDEKNIDYAQQTISLTQNFIQSNLHDRLLSIEEVINTFMLRFFQKRFKIEVTNERNTINISFKTTRDPHSRVFHNISVESGGGVMDMVSFILRIVCLSYTDNAKLIFLDEPFKNVSEVYKPLMVQIADEISKTFLQQIIMVLHDRLYISFADNFIHMEDNILLSEVEGTNEGQKTEESESEL